MSNQGNNGGWDPNNPHAQWQQAQGQPQQQPAQQQPAQQQYPQQAYPQQPQDPNAAYQQQMAAYQQQQQAYEQQMAAYQQQQAALQHGQGQQHDPNAYAQQQQPQQSYDPNAHAQQQQQYDPNAYAQQQQQAYDPNAYAQQQGYDPNAYAAQQQGYNPYQQSAAAGAGVSAYAGGFGASGPGLSGGRPIAGADATVDSNARLRFIRLTYLHLFGAIAVFAGIEWLLMKNETIFLKVSVPILDFAIGGGRWNWLVFMGLFMVVGYVADMWARSAKSRPMQYAGLGLYVVAEAVIFLPLLFLAELKGYEIAAKNGGAEVHIIRDAAVLTMVLFGALTASVLVTKKDFSFMRSGLMMGGCAATGIIVLAIVGGFNLGLIFSIAMVVLAAGYVLYYTSQILAHYHPEQYVAASLALFSAVALMFWYVIRIMMKLRE